MHTCNWESYRQPVNFLEKLCYNWCNNVYLDKIVSSKFASILKYEITISHFYKRNASPYEFVKMLQFDIFGVYILIKFHLLKLFK